MTLSMLDLHTNTNTNKVNLGVERDREIPNSEIGTAIVDDDRC